MHTLDIALRIILTVVLIVGGVLVIRKEWPQAAPPVATAPVSPPPTTGSITKKKTPPKLPAAPNFFSDPLGWLRWNEARNDALCAVEEPPHWCPRHR